jgi:hypothetical protein
MKHPNRQPSLQNSPFKLDKEVLFIVPLKSFINSLTDVRLYAISVGKWSELGTYTIWKLVSQTLLQQHTPRWHRKGCTSIEASSTQCDKTFSHIRILDCLHPLKAYYNCSTVYHENINWLGRNSLR